MIIKNKAENDFATKLSKENKRFIHQPKDNILSQIGYTPDFYVIDDKSYYEVIGSRQAFSQNRHKILKAREIAPLEIVKGNGEKYIFQGERNKNALTRISLKKSINYAHIGFDFDKFFEDTILTPEMLSPIININKLTLRGWAKTHTIKKEIYHLLKSKGYAVENYLVSK